MSSLIKHFRTIPIKLSDNLDIAQDKIPDRVQVIRCGKFSTPQNGDFEITPEMLLSFKKNFELNVRGIDLAIDYAHKSEDEAAAWFKTIELSDDGQELWCQVEWTPGGRRALADRKFRYLSADFTFNFINNETKQQYGPTLFGAGLTNRPVIKGMEPVVQLNERTDSMDPKDQKIAELEAKVADLQKAASAHPAAPAAKMVPGQEPDGDEQAMADLKKKLADAEAKCNEYAEKEKKMMADAVMSEKKTSFDKMLSEGKCVEAQREAFMKDDMKKFVELQAKLNLSEKGHGGAGLVVDDKSATSQIIEKAKKLSEDKKMPMSAAIAQIRKENPKLAEEHDKKF